METPLYRDVSIFLDFAIFFKMWKRLYIETYPQFLILPILESVETFLYRGVSTFLDFVQFPVFYLTSLVFHTVGQCGILTMIDTPILVIFENVETSLYS